MNHRYKILSVGNKQGWLTYNQLASCVAEGTPTVEIIDAINLAKMCGIRLLSNVESLPVAENIQEMCESQDLVDQMEELDEDEDDLDEDAA